MRANVEVSESRWGGTVLVWGGPCVGHFSHTMWATRIWPNSRRWVGGRVPAIFGPPVNWSRSVPVRGVSPLAATASGGVCPLTWRPRSVGHVTGLVPEDDQCQPAGKVVVDIYIYIYIQVHMSGGPRGETGWPLTFPAPGGGAP